jgi:trehalose-6-phosphate synthase
VIEDAANLRNTHILLFTLLLFIFADAMLTTHLNLRQWVHRGKMFLKRNLEPNLSSFPSNPELPPLLDDLQNLLNEQKSGRNKYADTAQHWTAERLRSLLRSELAGDEILVVSNREPYIHNRTEHGIAVQRPASGLVTAVEPIMRACSGTWIAHGSGTADREMVGEDDCVRVPPDAPTYTLRRVWLSDEEEKGYYNGFANEGLWPLCHIAHVRPVFRSSDWAQYVRVNERFAAAVIKEARTPDPVILIQDYHFALLPRLVREALPRATIITFWHIPWPNSESFGICPWREEILQGLLGSTILGFHTAYHRKNFLETVDRNLEARIEHEASTISYNGELTQVEAYPISIAWPENSVSEKDFAECRHAIRAELGLSEEHLLALGVDRLDYTKGIIERFLAVESLLESHPALVGKFSLIQIAAPSRSALDEYQNFENRVCRLEQRINQRFGNGNYRPILMRLEHHDPALVWRFYRATDVCLVTSLHDGMNLVAKEFIAARDDERGVLVLSQFTGAACELEDALIVNPYHVEQDAETLYQALTMPETEQRERMRSMRRLVKDGNIYRWAAHMLLDAARLRRRQRVKEKILALSETALGQKG